MAESREAQGFKATLGGLGLSPTRRVWTERIRALGALPGWGPSLRVSAGRWALDHLPGEVGGRVYFCSSGVYVNEKRMELQTARDAMASGTHHAPAWAQ